MLPHEDRYTRQRQLPEVGIDGQRQLSSIQAKLAPGSSSLVALIYLHRAGVGKVEVSSSAEPAVLKHQSLFTFDGPADVAAGCQVALAHIRGALHLDSAASGNETSKRGSQ